MQNQDSSRENLGSRLGFILLTAGCAIGLGNIWRFPFICGQYGGAIFVLIYLFFLIALGFPVMVMELSLGRASRRNIFGAYKTLAQDKRLKWHYPGAVFFLGNVVLMIFYTTVTGWMVAYALKFATGAFRGSARRASAGTSAISSPIRSRWSAACCSPWFSQRPSARSGSGKESSGSRNC